MHLVAKCIQLSERSRVCWIAVFFFLEMEFDVILQGHRPLCLYVFCVVNFEKGWKQTGPCQGIKMIRRGLWCQIIANYEQQTMTMTTTQTVKHNIGSHGVFIAICYFVCMLFIWCLCSSSSQSIILLFLLLVITRKWNDAIIFLAS